MIADEYIERTLPDPVIFLGERLRPLTLGQLMLMHRFNCAFVRGGPAGLSDLLLAVYILSHSYAEAADGFARGEHVQWSTEFSSNFKDRPFDVDEEIGLMRAFMDGWTKQPPLWMKEGGGGSLGSPFLAVLKLFMCEHLNLSALEAMEYPYALGYYEYGVWLECNGMGRMETQEEAADRDAAVAEYAERHPEFA